MRPLYKALLPEPPIINYRNPQNQIQVPMTRMAARNRRLYNYLEIYTQPISIRRMKWVPPIRLWERVNMG